MRAPTGTGRRSTQRDLVRAGLPWRLWKLGRLHATNGPLHVSMNDYLIHRPSDIARVAIRGLRFRAAWPRTPGAVGLWVAGSPTWRRQVSVSIWDSPEDLRRFVRSPAHLNIMRDFRGVGTLHTTSWSAGPLDRFQIWSQADARLTGRVDGVEHQDA